MALRTEARSDPRPDPRAKGDPFGRRSPPAQSVTRDDGASPIIPVRTAWAMAFAVVVLVGGAGCSKKLSAGGGAMDSFAYDVLKMDRGTGYYYQTLVAAHDPTNYAYRSTDDVYLADKCVDAIRHLGDARYDRLEGEAQVILLLSDVLLEDPIVLAKIQAAEALT